MMRLGSNSAANLRYLHRAIVALALLLSLSPIGCSTKPKTERPEQRQTRTGQRNLNVLLITIDTLRADYLGCYGRKAIATPNIDALAARGVRFTQAIAQVPLTAPSHASILTGTYPQVHKVRDMGGFILDSKIPTLASVMQQAGFETAAFVGAAVLNRHYGMNRGFSSYVDDMKDEAGAEHVKSVVGEVRGEVVTRRALDWLAKRASSKNFLLWLHYYDPHFPYDPPEPFRLRYSKDLYGGEVAYMDEQVGRLLQGLVDRRIADQTLIVLLADHGESLGDHGEYTHGVFLYDSTVHIPLIMAGPSIPRGKVVEQQVRSIDVMPTILDFLALSPGEQVQGVSLQPAIVEGKGVRTSYSYMETIYPKSQMGWSELRGIRTDEWKMIVAPKPELYRLSDDRAETRNVKDQFSAEANKLQKKVWEVAGPREGLGEIQPEPMDEKRRRELESLGYVSAGRRTLRIDMSGPDPKDRVGALEVLERAADAMNHDRFREAVPLLEKIARDDPTNPLIYKDLGICLQRLKRFDKAELVYREAIHNKADGDETHAKLGEIYVRRSDLPRAAESMERAAQLNPANLENLNNLTNVYLHQGRLDDAERVLRAMLAQNDLHAAAHNLFGILEIQRGREAQARIYFEKAVEYDPELTEAYMNLGLLAQNAGETKLAIAYYKKFLKRAKPDKYGDIIPKVKTALAELEFR